MTRVFIQAFYLVFAAFCFVHALFRFAEGDPAASVVAITPAVLAYPAWHRSFDL